MKNQKNSIIGVGKLGLCLGLNLEKRGHKVMGYDLRNDYMESINRKTFRSEVLDQVKKIKRDIFEYESR